MRRGLIRAAAIGALAVAPAGALAEATTYEDASIDGTASIQLKITDGDDRKVKQVVARKLPYSGFGCIGTGRTDRVEVKGRWRVKGNGEFRVVGSYEGSTGPGSVDGGQLNVVGDATRNRVSGTVKFTYGKTGCQTEKLAFEAGR